ncbi:MAG: DUF5615 family PIN-like protein [Chloroflexota bacterium]
MSLKFLTDEDVPRSTARVLLDAGFDAVDVRDIGLRGKNDTDVFLRAQEEQRIIISCDMGFSNILHYPPSDNAGILVVRIPDSEPIDRFNKEILRAVNSVGDKLSHHLAIVEIGKVRLRG